MGIVGDGELFFELPSLHHPSHTPVGFIVLGGLLTRIQKLQKPKTFLQRWGKGLSTKLWNTEHLENSQQSNLLKNSQSQQEERLEINRHVWLQAVRKKRRLRTQLLQNSLQQWVESLAGLTEITDIKRTKYVPDAQRVIKNFILSFIHSPIQLVA